MRECYQLLENPTVLPYNKLFKATEEVFEANNIDVLDSSRFYLRRNLEKHVDFIKELDQPITTQNIIKWRQQVKKEIKEMKDSMPWPPQPNDLAPKIEIPQSLILFVPVCLFL